MNCQAKYEIIMRAERLLFSGYYTSIPAYDEMCKLTSQILEIAKSNLVLRSYNLRYGVTKDTIAYESVGAHTNLMMAIMDRALCMQYGDETGTFHVGMHTYRSIMEAIRWHDLPENDMGDIPDNGDRDEQKKREQEEGYFYLMSRLMPASAENLTPSVLLLLSEMENKSSELGRMLYLADKMSALIMTLCYDLEGLEARMSKNSPYASPRDLLEMNICDDNKAGSFRASEMWAVDYFKARDLVRYDDTGFFTALLVVATLYVKGSWYQWRNRDY